jgi:cytochrome c556
MLRYCKLVLVATILVSTASHADDEDVIDYRSHVMKTMGEQVAIIGMMLQGKIPADDFAAHVRVLAITAGTAKPAFEPEVPGGDSRPEVWEDWPDFEKRLDDLATATAELAEIADDGGMEAAGAKVKEALSCKGCHDKYRIPESE